ncbi:MAG: type II toxin-antitoxin system RelB/DinJ family antitoxin [Pseudobutyrivibrio sp.]|nr:type II toxin-antitoxin system RelB/DinJ family antitoxin [Pseudobutyrivibrio sp.]
MKNSTVSARVEDNIKKEAEDILQKLGLPVSVVIDSLYRQIIYTKGIPFSLTIPHEPRTMDDLSSTELIKKLQHSHYQAQNNQGRPLDEVFANLENGIK